VEVSLPLTLHIYKDRLWLPGFTSHFVDSLLTKIKNIKALKKKVQSIGQIFSQNHHLCNKKKGAVLSEGASGDYVFSSLFFQMH